MLRPLKPGNGGGKPGGSGSGGGSWSDNDLQTATYSTKFSPGVVFAGQGFTGAIPPDPNLAVGMNNGTTQIMQVVNTTVDIYAKDGTPQLASPVDLGALFSYLPNTNCSANPDGGDVIVLYDQIDGRWLLSQLAYNSTFSQNDLCLAISETSDATGNYYLYDISFGGSVPDYPKLAVWGDGIYFSANMFQLSVNPLTGSVRSRFQGARACSFPLSDVSSPPDTVTMTCSAGGNTAIYNILPASLDGSTKAPTSLGDYYLQFVTNLSSTSGNDLQLYQLQGGNLVALSPMQQVATYYEACGGTACIPQSGTTMLLDSIGDRLMYRLSYRNDGTTQTMVVNHSVQVSSASNQTGIRWYKLCSPSSTTASFNVCGQGTFSPDASTYRWMGSIAQDQAGNLGLGYSASGSATYPYPSIVVTGMENGSSDAGMENEYPMFYGKNFQDTYNRWGDYSSMVVDPKDGCTFWYTTEYSTTTNVLGVWNFFWGTEIGSFNFPDNCPANP